MIDWNNKEERNKYHTKYYHKRRNAIIEELGGKCVVCGTTKNLELDHINPSVKTMNFNSVITKTRTDEISKELENCQVLCTWHHNEKTVSEKDSFTHGTQYGWMKKKCECIECLLEKKIWNTKRNQKRRVDNGRGYSKNPPHGTSARYSRKCRCIDCRAANAAKERKRLFQAKQFHQAGRITN